MYIYEENYIVDFRDMDMDYNVKIPHIMQLFGTIATKHSDKVGIDPLYLQRKNMAWVLYEYNVQMFHKTNLYAKTIKIQTFVKQFKNMYILRYFLLYDEHKNIIGRASSKWVIIDFEKRKLIKLPKDITEKLINNNILLTPEQEYATNIASTKISSLNLHQLYNDKKLNTDNINIFNKDFDVRYFDIDPNAHVNNTVYPVWAIESLSDEKEFLSKYKVEHLEIVYKKELRFGNKKVKSYYTKKENHTTHHEIYNENQDLLAIVIIKWDKKNK